MSFDEKYQLVDLVEDENAKIFVAEEISTGRKVSVFLFVGEQARLHADLIERLRMADHRQFPELIETGNNQGTPYVVTQPLSGFSELKNRILRIQLTAEAPTTPQRENFSKVGMWHVPQILSAAPAAQKPSDETAKEPQPTKQPADAPIVAPPPSGGEFTRMFQTPAAPLGEPTVNIPKAAPQQMQSPPTPPPPPSGGEFTRMFQTPAAPLGEPTVNIPKAAPRQTQTAPPPPSGGEFTRVFQAAAPPLGEPAVNAPTAPEPPAAQPRPPQSAPGEFTRFFQSASTTPVPPMPNKTEAKGEFTRVFGGSGRPEAPAAASTRLFESPPPPGEGLRPEKPEVSRPSPPKAFGTPAGEFTRVFGGASMETLPPAKSTPPAAENPAPPAAPGAAGEYTRMFSAPPKPEEPAAAPEPAGVPSAASASPAPAKSNSRLPLILTGVIFVLLVVIVALIFTLWK